MDDSRLEPWGYSTPSLASGGYWPSRCRRSKRTTTGAAPITALRSRLSPGRSYSLIASNPVITSIASYPIAFPYPPCPAATAASRAAQALPALAGGTDAVSLAARFDARVEPVGSDAVHVRVRSPRRVALAGVLRTLVRDRRMAAPGSQVTLRPMAFDVPPTPSRRR